MKARLLKSILVIALVGASAATMAAKPEWAGPPGNRGQTAQEVQIGGYFQDQQRQAALRYYGGMQAQKRCPPGLAKKHNGCMPPGLAKQWSRGEPLPASVITYPVPAGVISRIGLPPAGYKYVRVANDLLLVSVGTMMVMDAIEDLMRP